MESHLLKSEQHDPENGFVVDFENTLQENNQVIGNLAYRVAVPGVFLLLDLVPCKLGSELIPTCAFLTATIIGLDPTKVKQR
jgi:hypothetical protein